MTHKTVKYRTQNTKLLLYERPILEKISINYGLADVHSLLECRLQHTVHTVATFQTQSSHLPSSFIKCHTHTELGNDNWGILPTTSISYRKGAF
jgi:hypothetical protein